MVFRVYLEYFGIISLQNNDDLDSSRKKIEREREREREREMKTKLDMYSQMAQSNIQSNLANSNIFENNYKIIFNSKIYGFCIRCTCNKITRDFIFNSIPWMMNQWKNTQLKFDPNDTLK
jgi:hypothetical protein